MSKTMSINPGDITVIPDRRSRVWNPGLIVAAGFQKSRYARFWNDGRSGSLRSIVE